MPQAISVLLQVDDISYDLNKMGLMQMTFDRFLGAPENIKSGVLSNLDITMYDESGYKLLNILQKNRNKIKLKYGFTDNMSPVYQLTAIKVNSNFDNMGVSVAINGIAQQTHNKFPADLFVKGTPIETIVRQLAARNNWYIGDGPLDKSHVDGNELLLPVNLVKKQDETDIEFILDKLKPLCNKSVTVIKEGASTIYWDIKLTHNGASAELFFRPYTERTRTRRVWKYTYGTSTDNSIINLTNRIDMSYLLDGLTIKIPITTETMLLDDATATQYVEEKIAAVSAAIDSIATKYNIPLISNNNDFKFNIELYQAENAGEIPLEDLLLQKVEDAVQAINTCELTVIGNPDIMPTDLIELVVKNRDGNLNIISSNSSGGSYWRIIGVKESIGLSGYQTTLNLVRETLIK